MLTLASLPLVSFLLLSEQPSPARTIVEVRTGIPVDQDGCLDHTVKELGMSAKRQEDKSRLWNIRPQFLHPSVTQGGTLTVRFDKGERATAIVALATWPGDKKEKAIEDELEERLRLMVTKMAQLCGVTKPELHCALTEAGKVAVSCSPPTSP